MIAVPISFQGEAINRDDDRSGANTGKTDDGILVAGGLHGVSERFLAAIEDVGSVRGCRARKDAEEDERYSEISHIGTSRFIEEDDSRKRWQINRSHVHGLNRLSLWRGRCATNAPK